MRLRTSTCEIPRFNRVIKKILAAITFFSRSPHRFKHMRAEVIFKKLALFESFQALYINLGSLSQAALKRLSGPGLDGRAPRTSCAIITCLYIYIYIGTIREYY